VVSISVVTETLALRPGAPSDLAVDGRRTGFILFYFMPTLQEQVEGSVYEN
jgi:hypothetical protein